MYWLVLFGFQHIGDTSWGNTGVTQQHSSLSFTLEFQRTAGYRPAQMQQQHSDIVE